MEDSPALKNLHLTASASLILLILLCALWELVLAPLRPGGSWMVLKALPLLAPLPGTLRRNIYTMQWASMMVLMYFTEGVVRAWSEQGPSQWLAFGEIVLSSLYFFSAIFFLRPYKREAKRLAREAIQRASENHEH